MTGHRGMTAAVVATTLLLCGFAGGSAGRYAEVPAAGPPVPVAAPTADVPVRPVADWAREFLLSWDFEYETSLPVSRSADSWDHYELSYVIDANTAMFRATGETRYLDRALEYVTNVVATAVPSSALPASQYKDGYRGWASHRPDLDRPGTEVPLYESYFWRYATTLLRVMRQTPAVYADPAYRARYDALLAFAETHVFGKWDARGADENIFRSRTHMAAHWALIAANLAAVSADEQRAARYRLVAADIDGRLRGQLRRHPSTPAAYFWSDVWGSARLPGQDVSHGNGVLAYIVEAHDLGTFWTDADLAAFGATLTRVIWPGGTTYRDYVDGSGTGNGWFADGFVKLGRAGRAVQARLDTHAVVNEQFAANMALNAKVLEGR